MTLLLKLLCTLGLTLQPQTAARMPVTVGMTAPEDNMVQTIPQRQFRIFRTGQSNGSGNFDATSEMESNATSPLGANHGADQAKRSSQILVPSVLVVEKRRLEWPRPRRGHRRSCRPASR